MAERFLSLCIWAAALFGGLLFFMNAANLIARDVPGDYVEGVVLLAQADTARGESPYSPQRWVEMPYRINLYGPVFYKLGAWVLPLGGQQASLRPGRVLSLVALVLAFLAVWKLTREGSRVSASSMVLGVLLSLGFVPVLIFGPQNRVDTLAVALSVAGFLFGLKQDRKAPLVAGIFFVISVFTKPTAIAAPAVLFFSLAFQKKFREAVMLAGTCLVLGGLWLGALWVLTQGGFTTSLFRFNANPFAIGGLIKALQQAFSSPVLPLCAGLALAFFLSGKAAERAISAYFLVSLVMAVLTVGKVGANLNYFLEPGILMAAVTAQGWERLRGELTGLAVAVAIVGSGLLFSGPRVLSELSGRRQRQDVEKTLIPLLAGKSVVTMEVATALRAGAVPVLNDPHIFARLAEAGRWDEAPLVSDLLSARVDLVLADADLSAASPAFSNYSSPVRKAIVSRYRLDRQFGPNLWLYVPREEKR